MENNVENLYFNLGGERVNKVNQRLRIEDCGLSFLRDQQLGTNSVSIP